MAAMRSEVFAYYVRPPGLSQFSGPTGVSLVSLQATHYALHPWLWAWPK